MSKNGKVESRHALDPISQAKALIEAKQQERTQACFDEIRAALHRYNCRLVVVQTGQLGEGSFHYDPVVLANPD